MTHATILLCSSSSSEVRQDDCEPVSKEGVVVHILPFTLLTFLLLSCSVVSTRGNSRGNLERMESMGSMLTSRSSRHMGGGDDQCPSFRNMVSARRGDMTSRRGDMTARSTLNEPLPSRRGDMTSRSNLNDSMATARSRAGDASARSLRTARSLRGGGLLSASPSTSAQDIAT